MSNDRHLAKIKGRVQDWNNWRLDNPNVKPDLSGVTLSNLSLEGANLSNAFLDNAALEYSRLDDADLSNSLLVGANLNGARLDGASFQNADLKKSHMVGATLIETNLTGASLVEAFLDSAMFVRSDLSHANLMNAVLTRACLINVKLEATNLTGIIVAGTTFSDIDFRSVIGLSEVDHLFPSSLGIDSIIRSQGGIDHSFLRGIGLPNPLIDRLPAILVRSRFYSCFLCNSSQDDGFASRLYKDLQNLGVLCWHAKSNLKMGDKIRPTLHREIRNNEKVVVVLSEHSIESTWVEDEVEAALAYEREQNTMVLIPIRLDDTVFKVNIGWAAALRTRNIGDFRHWWNLDDYQQSLSVLRNALSAEIKPK